jgi:hypothetical protein
MRKKKRMQCKFFAQKSQSECGSGTDNLYPAIDCEARSLSGSANIDLGCWCEEARLFLTTSLYELPPTFIRFALNFPLFSHSGLL